MPRPAAHALIWCPKTQTYTVRDPAHARTLLAVFGNALTFCPESQEWFAWLERIPSFAFEGREGRFTARRETKQHGEGYWIAYRRSEGNSRRKTSAGPATSQRRNSSGQPDRSLPGLHPPAPGREAPTEPTAPAPFTSPADWTFPDHVRNMDIGQTIKGPHYDDMFWLPDRSHFSLVAPTKERCPIHPTARWHLRDGSGQAWCTHSTCWRRYNLVQLGSLINYHHLLGCDQTTFIAVGVESWAIYASEKDDARIEFSLHQAIMYCTNLDLPLPDLSENARLHAPVYDAWK